MEISADVELDFAIVPDESLKADIWTKFRFWLDIDLTNSENPQFKMIYKLPVDDKFHVEDLSALVYEEDFSLESFGELIDKYSGKEATDEINNILRQILAKHMSVTEVEENVYELSADDKALKSIVKESCVELVEYIGAIVEVYDYELEDDFIKQVENIYAKLEPIQLLGKDGLKIIVKIKDGYVISCDTSLHICLNAYDIAAAFGADMDKFDRDKFWIDGVLKIESTLENPDSDVSVEFPVLTEENTHKSVDEDDQYSEYVSDWLDLYFVGEPVVINDEPYVPLRALLEEMSVSDIQVENGVIMVNSADLPEFNKLTVTEFSNKIIVDEEEKFLNNNVVEIGGISYVPLQFIEYINCEVLDFNSRKSLIGDDKSYWIDIYRPLVEH